ncbi:proline iminopeptidase-family hydrolase [Pontibacter harenae]|uniref:proline iminopeptidase-family hydrolase n=1 Tax=Pontibacter harenae TaxID=2894083 RepID=UPI001E5F39B5|nr:proline iminopeptidase-family hydrolase [Pontibacter harenae]MCC9168142.1 proline iminopeptidase-family hydrolase [Pontibacter harenae]
MDIFATKEEHTQLREGYKVYTKTVGEGDVKLLTIHGGPGLTHECFANFPEYLCLEGVQVVLYDQLGSFHSDQPDDPSLWNLPRFVDELHQVVVEHALENQFVFANSWGAMILIEYLLKYQTSFRGVILAGMPASFRKFKQNIKQLRTRLSHDVIKQLEEHEREGTTADPAYRQLLFEHWYGRHYCVLKPWPEPLLSGFGHLAVPVLVSLFGGNAFDFDGPATSWDRSGYLGKIKTPALLTAGREDLVFEEDLKFMADRMPNAEWFISPTGGHFCWWKDGEAYFGRLSRFIREHR